MDNRRSLLLVTMMAAMLGAVVPAFAQDDQESVAPPVEAVPEMSIALPVKNAAPQAEEVIYGEVQAMNAALNVLTVQYYDYDKDEEKSVDIVTSSQTKIENAATLSDIKQGDWVDVKYVVVDKKNTAKLISVEREEEPADTSAIDLQAPTGAEGE